MIGGGVSHLSDRYVRSTVATKVGVAPLESVRSALSNDALMAWCSESRPGHGVRAELPVLSDN